MPVNRARRSGRASDRWPSAWGQAHLRVLAALGLIVGVVAMHSLGLGHGPMSEGHPMSAGTTQTAAADAPTEPPALHTTTSVMTDMEAVSRLDPAHGMGAMCLAVIPFLGLLVARMLGFRIRGLGRATPPRPARGGVRSERAPPAYRCPSLSRLCILRT